MMFELSPSMTKGQFATKISMTAKTTFGIISEISNTPHETSSTRIPADQSVLVNQRETMQATTAWILFAMMSILFSGSLTINVIVLAFLVYKKSKVGGKKLMVNHSEFEIEGNSCYEATEMKQSSESEEHVYDTVRVKRAK